jgi:predicted XRE-type DNA-binding protein
MTGERFDDVFEALCDTPAEARHLAMRSDLTDAIETVVSSWKLSQAEAARRLGLTQPRLKTTSCAARSTNSVWTP